VQVLMLVLVLVLVQEATGTGTEEVLVWTEPALLDVDSRLQC
jgi:hypothetical protein